MSVLMQLSMFPTNTQGSKSKEVSEILKIIRDSGLNYQLTSMNTIVEAKTLNPDFAIGYSWYKLIL